MSDLDNIGRRPKTDPQATCGCLTQEFCPKHPEIKVSDSTAKAREIVQCLKTEMAMDNLTDGVMETILAAALEAERKAGYTQGFHEGQEGLHDRGYRRGLEEANKLADAVERADWEEMKTALIAYQKAKGL